MKFRYIALTTLLLSSHAFAESFPPTKVEVSQQSTKDNGFTYPDTTYLESDSVVNDVVFFYSKDMLSYFNNDVEDLVMYVQDAVDINNLAFKRQDIPLRRKIAGIVEFPSENDYNDEAYGEDRLLNLDRMYKRNRFDETYDASYIVALTKHYPDIVSSIGLAYVGGKFSWLSPYKDRPADRTLAHELGHNDGFAHDLDSYNGYSDRVQSNLARPYAIGTDCGTFDSVMKSGTGSRSEGFFSSPLVTNDQGVACGTDEVEDSARAYREALNNEIKNQERPFSNNKPSKIASGTVSLSLPSTVINEGEPITVEVIWSGAEVGDMVQLMTKKGSADLNDFESSLISLEYEEGKTNVVQINTINDDAFEINETLTVELIHPHGINLSDNAFSQEVTLSSEDIGNAGIINFSESTLTFNEGQTKTITLNRTGGSDGEFTVSINTSLGTANDDDFTLNSDNITFTNGEASKQFNLSIKNDTDEEPSESFSISLSGESQVIGSNNTITVTINASDSATNNTTNNNTTSNGGGGSMGIFTGLLLLLISIRRRQTSLKGRCITASFDYIDTFRR
jgi:hypothetical protein